ncbi:MAG: prepilin-type N-terminal cleavage/methylation domain-containing protein [Candidatus Omnitrophica bacterium]|nr:prepilin-type N-terminal cleavage/methylation domain-containing protein [Candidatus Omnitrophota bacterium]
MKKIKGFTLVEVLITLFVTTIGVGVIFIVYPVIFRNIDIEMAQIKAWEIARAEVEILRNTIFTDSQPFRLRQEIRFFEPPDTPQANIFYIVAIDDSQNAPQPRLRVLQPNEVGNFSGVYYVERLRDVNNALIDNLVFVEVVVCYRAGNRVIGEDVNLNGVLDSGEDVNNDGKISSPITLSTFIGKL